jgi:ABC-2 type transport system permease protein
LEEGIVRKLFLVASREFRQQIRKRGFLLSSFAVPVLLLIIWAATGVFSTTPQQPSQDLLPTAPPQKPIGYVDQAGLITRILPPAPADLFQAFPNVEAADAALAAGDIGAYYLIPPDYRGTGQIRRVSEHLPTSPPEQSLVSWILVSNLFPDLSPEQVMRLNWPFNATSPKFVNVTPQGETGGGGGDFLPFLVTIAIIMPLFTSGGYLLQSLAQEKSNRVMEILLVSLRPRQLLMGKLLGLGALTLVQYAIWFVIAGLAAIITGQAARQFLSSISLTGGELALVIPYALGGYLLYAGLMAGIGAMTPDVEGSRAWIFVISLPMLLPIYLWTAIAGSPNGTLAVVLSLIPFSAPVTMLLRLTSTAVPGWQIAASLALLLAGGIGIVFAMARLFRVQTLLSGESLTMGRLLSALTHGG